MNDIIIAHLPQSPTILQETTSNTCAPLFLFIQAQETYKTATEQGRTAFLLEEAESSRDIFYCCLGNLPAQCSTTIRFSYVLELAVQVDGGVKYVLPTTLKPRYNPTAEGNVNKDQNGQK